MGRSQPTPIRLIFVGPYQEAARRFKDAQPHTAGGGLVVITSHHHADRTLMGLVLAATIPLVVTHRVYAEVPDSDEWRELVHYVYKRMQMIRLTTLVPKKYPDCACGACEADPIQTTTVPLTHPMVVGNGVAPPQEPLAGQIIYYTDDSTLYVYDDRCEDWVQVADPSAVLGESEVDTSTICIWCGKVCESIPALEAHEDQCAPEPYRG